MPPAIPREHERLAALADFSVLDTANEPEFDAITRLIAHICGTPMALISLVDERRQWFKSHFGLAATETPRDVAVCAHAIAQDDVFIIPDLARDARFADNPLIVDDPHLRFYAGSVLRTSEGHALGTLCVLDEKPRSLSPEQVDALKTLSSHVTVLLEARRSLEANRQMRAQLEATLASRQHLIATVSHDLRSPLSVVSMGTAGLSVMLEGRSDVQPTLQRISRATQSMVTLVDDLLDFEAFEANGVPLQPQPTDIAGLLTEAVDTFVQTAQARGISIRTSAAHAIAANIDGNRIRQVLANFIGNAVKVMSAGGVITLSSEKRGSAVRVAVADTGPGIPADHLEHVFDPFWRADLSNKGAGLGLTICKRIVEAHGGRIGVDSNFGHGAVFWFELPALT